MSLPTSSFLTNMLWARTNSHRVSHRAVNARNPHRYLQLPWSPYRSGIFKHLSEAAMSKELDRLRNARGKLASFLHCG